MIEVTKNANFTKHTLRIDRTIPTKNITDNLDGKTSTSFNLQSVTREGSGLIHKTVTTTTNKLYKTILIFNSSEEIRLALLGGIHI